MNQLPAEIQDALQNHHLLVVWGDMPFELAEHAPNNRAAAIDQWIEQAKGLPAIATPLIDLPPLPILSLDPADRVEQRFRAADVKLRVVKSTQDVSTPQLHTLIKLAGDLNSRTGLVLSRDEVRSLLSDADKRYLIDLVRSIVQVRGAVLLVGCDPANADFKLWWSILASTFARATCFALGDPSATWPKGVMCLSDQPATFLPLIKAAWKLSTPKMGSETKPGWPETYDDKSTQIPGTKIVGEKDAERQFILSQIEDLKANIKRGQDEIRQLDGVIAQTLSARQIQDVHARQALLQSQVSAWQATYAQLLVNLQQGSTNDLSMAEPAHGKIIITEDDQSVIIDGLKLSRQSSTTPSTQGKAVTSTSTPVEVQTLRLDTAVPERVFVNRSFDLAVAVRQASSPVLVTADLTRTDQGDVQVVWPEGEPFIRLRVEVSAPESECEIAGKASQSFRLLRGKDSPVFYFHLTPKQSGDLSIFVTVYQEDDSLGSARVHTVAVDQPVGQVQVTVTSQALAASNVDRASLQRQLSEARKNLALIEDRMAEYVLSIDVPLQLIKEQQRLKDRIAQLENQLNE